MCFTVLTLFEAEQLLAYATSDGAVGIVRIKQTLEAAENLTSFGTGQKVTADLTEADTLMTADRRAVTSLKWIEGSDSHTVGSKLVRKLPKLTSFSAFFSVISLAWFTCSLKRFRTRTLHGLVVVS